MNIGDESAKLYILFVMDKLLPATTDFPAIGKKQLDVEGLDEYFICEFVVAA